MNTYTIKRKLYLKYDVELDPNKILYIHKPINVGDFILIKKLSKDYKDIRVEPRSALRL